MFIDLRGKGKEGDWSTFPLEGYRAPVTGFFHTKKNPAQNGMAFGGIGTGCLDIESDGTLGLMTLFNSLAPRRGPLNLPWLGLSCGTETHILTTRPFQGYPADAYTQVLQKRASPVRDIVYFGH